MWRDRCVKGRGGGLGYEVWMIRLKSKELRSTKRVRSVGRGRGGIGRSLVDPCGRVGRSGSSSLWRRHFGKVYVRDMKRVRLHW